MGEVTWCFEARDCPICGASRTRSSRLGRRGGAAHRLGLGCQTGIVRCRRCHGVYPLPTPIPQGNPYLQYEAEDYFKGHDSQGKVTVGENVAHQAERILGAKGKLLEIGCGRGELLRGAANLGWDVRGIEMTETFARIAKTQFEVTVETSPVETAHALQEQWDVVVLAGVLEHVYDPTTLLARIRAGLRPGGIVYIDVPNECSLYSRIANLYFRLAGRDWAVNLSPTFPPFHVVGFCPVSLKWALAKTEFSPLRFDLYKMESSLTPSGSGFRASLEGGGLRASLALGHVLGMSAGITCWARRA